MPDEETASIEVPLRFTWAMSDHEGTAPLRIVAGHAQRVGAAWQALSEEMKQLADALDRLVEAETAS